MCVVLSLGFIFCSINLYFCLCANTILSWWLWLCSVPWNQAGWFLQFHSSFSRLLWLFEAFCISDTNCEIICSSSLKNTVGSLIGIELNYRLLWAVYWFSLCWFFQSMNMVYFSIYLCYHWFPFIRKSKFYSFIYIGLPQEIKVL